ncbi:hypothetical protein GCM10009676_07870 [Prauserella halophila]|uniref:Tryptophan-associated transmembrane protein n=1 Tax=Prauserella halophila TaxID=185641 RepID=A0ABN1W147_9PSEU|nr:hypothetical protein [Prauserella halophila]MCP2237161.1 hypothetical protein [Prauserella halophila]
MVNSRPTAVVVRTTATALTGVGLVLAVVGTFLPWFSSGDVNRSSYETAGLVEHFRLAGGAEEALTVWAGVPLLAAVFAATLATRFVRTAAALCLVLSLPVGTVAVLVAVRAGERDQGLIGIAPSGPVVTALGMGLTAVAALVTLAVAGPAHRATQAAAVDNADVPQRHD